MTCKTVKTQAELDAALADTGVDCVHIESGRGVWLELGNRDKTVEARGSASVRAFDSASVSAFGSASVRAFGSASVRAFGSASVRAFDSASVSAFDSASVRAFDSASVRASGSASVRAFDSASVSASGSASVRAFGSASVRASGASRVSAYDRSTTQAGPHVAVHLHSGQATVDGGVVIDLTDLDLHDPQTWCDHNGVEVLDGHAVLYKALDDDLITGRDYDHPVTYTAGTDLICTDWQDNHHCGGGLHLSPTPTQATDYRSGATRWMRCTAPLHSLRPILDGGSAKCKVAALHVQAEVDLFGRELAIAPAVS